MIDPKKITDFNRSDSELQEFWLFCIAVAGKTASQIALKIDDFLSPRKAAETPYEFIRRLVAANSLRTEMERVKLGKYELLSKAYSFSVSDAGPDLRKASVQDLEALMKAEAEAHAMPLADFDLAVWNHYSSGGVDPLPVAA